jgi:hypothetical protein
MGAGASIAIKNKYTVTVTVTVLLHVALRLLRCNIVTYYCHAATSCNTDNLIAMLQPPIIALQRLSRFASIAVRDRCLGCVAKINTP